MFAKQQSVIAGRLGIGATIPAIVGLEITVTSHIGAITVDPIKHGLDTSGVAVPGSGWIAKKIGRNMFYCIQPEAIAFGGVKNPHHCSNQIGINIFRNGDTISAIEWMPRASECRSCWVHIVLGIVWVANTGELGSRAPEGVAEIAVD